MADTRIRSQGSLRLHQVMQLSLARPLSSSKCEIIGVYETHKDKYVYVLSFLNVHLLYPKRQLATCQ